MGIFDNIFGDSKSKIERSSVNWIQLNDISQLEVINSNQNLVVIFKHSTRCGISRFALNRFEKEMNIENENIQFYFLDILANRNISNEISTIYGIRHESPQLILFKNGKVLYYASHGNISISEINDLIAN